MRGALESKEMKVNIRKTKVMGSGTEGEIVRSKVDPKGKYVVKELCLMRCYAQCVRIGFTLDAP